MAAAQFSRMMTRLIEPSPDLFLKPILFSKDARLLLVMYSKGEAKVKIK